MAFSPNGRCFATGGSDKLVKIWEIGTNVRVTGPFHEVLFTLCLGKFMIFLQVKRVKAKLLYMVVMRALHP